jgi:hypothetical protein
VPANADPASHHPAPIANDSQRPAEPTATRRQVLAFLALADAPVPDSVEFHGDRFSIDLNSRAAGRIWTDLFGGEPWHDSAVLDVPASERFGARWSVIHELADWRGWVVSIHVTEWKDRPGTKDLDTDTREQLATVAAGGTP